MNRTHNHQVAIQVASELGLPVFPVRENDTTYIDKKSGKTLTLKAKSPYTRNGFKDATKNLNQIDALWLRSPNAAVGVPTGPETSLLVIDKDTGDGKVGEQSWTETGIVLPHTVQTKTMSGGEHYIFNYPADHIIRNSAGTSFGPDLDVRGLGGYVVWAGSALENGKYEFKPGHSPAEAPFADLTPEILGFLTSSQNKTTKKIAIEHWN